MLNEKIRIRLKAYDHRVLDGVRRVPTESMLLARRVPELLAEERQHRLEHTRIHRCGRVVIEINQLKTSWP